MSKLNALLWMKLHKTSKSMADWVAWNFPFGECRDVDALLGATIQGAMKIARKSWQLCAEEKDRVSKRKRDGWNVVVQPCAEWLQHKCKNGDRCPYIHAKRASR